MSRTRRFYNKPNILKTAWRDIYRPYQWICMGHCKRCKDSFLGRRRKLDRRKEAMQTIEIEMDMLK